MASDDRDLAWYLQRAAEADLPDDSEALGRGDWGRLSQEAFLARSMVSARAIRSGGSLRLSGAGVEGHLAELAHVGAIASAWQEAILATGAALEEVKTLKGSLPADIVQRTSLLLNASPQPGSVVLFIEPKQSPLAEAEPSGNVAMMDAPRPLADRASQQLISWLHEAGAATPAEADALSDGLRDLGPRVGSSLNSLAKVLDRTNITLDAAWREPEAATVRANVTPAAARWISEFVSGRGLDASVENVVGILRTVSDRENWLVNVGDEEWRMDASDLDSAVASQWNVGTRVRLSVRVALTERPDGSTRVHRTLVSVSADDQPEEGT